MERSGLRGRKRGASGRAHLLSPLHRLSLPGTETWPEPSPRSSAWVTTKAAHAVPDELWEILGGPYGDQVTGSLSPLPGIVVTVDLEPSCIFQTAPGSGFPTGTPGASCVSQIEGLAPCREGARSWTPGCGR